MALTNEQYADMKSVWERMEKEHPEFTPWMDPLNNYHAVREIVLGGSVTWRGVHERFRPGPGTFVMDIGANAGIFTAFCAANGAHVAAYEPFARPYSILLGMLAATGLISRVQPRNHAVWTYTGTVKYFGNISTLDNVCPAFNGSLHTDGINWTPDDEKHALEVPCVSLDLAIGCQEWDCVKIDVEGAEFEMLLQASPDTLRRIKFAYIEFHPWASRDLYDRTCRHLEQFFIFEGSVPREDNRWEAAYLTRK